MLKATLPYWTSSVWLRPLESSTKTLAYLQNQIENAADMPNVKNGFPGSWRMCDVTSVREKNRNFGNFFGLGRKFWVSDKLSYIRSCKKMKIENA